MAAGRDGGERYPTPPEGYTTPTEGYTTPAEGYTTSAEGYTTPAEGYTTPAERWSNSATRHRTSREDSSTQQTTERIVSKKMDDLLYRKIMTPPILWLL